MILSLKNPSRNRMDVDEQSLDPIHFENRETGVEFDFMLGGDEFGTGGQGLDEPSASRIASLAPHTPVRRKAGLFCYQSYFVLLIVMYIHRLQRERKTLHRLHKNYKLFHHLQALRIHSLNCCFRRMMDYCWSQLCSRMSLQVIRT